MAVEGRSQAVTVVVYTAMASEGRGVGCVWLERSLPARPELFAGLCILGFANGIAGRVHLSVIRDGVAVALANTFSISAVVWIAFVACPMLLLRIPREAPTRADLTMAACALGAFMLPLDPLSWVALTMLALYILRDTLLAFTRCRPEPLSFAHRGAWVLLATTVVMLWAKLLLAIASNMILRLDAILVGWLSGTRRVGNTVQFADGAGAIWIEPPCSSVANVSLAVLCWTLFAQARGLRWTMANAGWCLLACLAVVGINAARIGSMALNRDQFDLIHGPMGTTIVSWLTVAAMVGICALGTRQGSLSRA